MLLQKYIYEDLRLEKIKDLGTGRYSFSKGDEKKIKLVKEIILAVKENGDKALLDFAKKWENRDLNSLKISRLQLQKIANSLTKQEKRAIDMAYKNILNFHTSLISSFKKVETMPGVVCWKESRPIDRVGIYIPGGSAPLLSTFLMLGIPAKLAGVREIVVCTPPQKNDPIIHPALAYISGLLEIDGLNLAGGAQAVAAMAYGTQSIQKVDKIFGPGNSYVTLAKQLIQLETQTSIDMPAGPSEVLIIGTESSNPDFIASDLLAQAEHGPDSQVVLVSTSESLLEKVQTSLLVQLNELPRKEIALKALANSFSLLVKDLKVAFEFSNQYAPEHLILSFPEAENFKNQVNNAGSVFLGAYSPESAGDYASGTNHTLPTSGFAKMYSGVSVESFVKNISFQSINPSGLKALAETITTLAHMEGLDGHARSVTIRL